MKRASPCGAAVIDGKRQKNLPPKRVLTFVLDSKGSPSTGSRHDVAR